MPVIIVFTGFFRVLSKKCCKIVILYNNIFFHTIFSIFRKENQIQFFCENKNLQCNVTPRKSFPPLHVTQIIINNIIIDYLYIWNQKY